MSILSFDGLISDHLVLQRRQPITLRGRAMAGVTVDITLADVAGRTTANATGEWRIELPALEAGGPHGLQAHAADETCEVRDVLIGEVWLCSGQSNMDWRLGDTRDAAFALSVADRHPDIRLLVMPRTWTPGGDPHVQGIWEVGSRATAATFSAVGYQFGLRLQRELGVPVGLIDAARGGSLIHSWLPREALANDAAWAPRLASYLDGLSRQDALLTAHREAQARWVTTMPPADPGISELARGWSAVDLDESDWKHVDLPCWWQRGGHDASGVLWFRRTVDIPAHVAAHGLTLHLGACDKGDRTFINGIEVGAMAPDAPDAWRTPRVYQIPSSVLHPGRNVIAVRVFSNIHQGGMTGPAPAMRLVSAAWSLPLAGPWRWKIELDFGRITAPATPWGPGNPDSPAILYESLVAPARLYRIAGVIWYQGESNEYGPDEYRRLFPMLIRAWRRAWGQEFPFLFVQLPGFGSRVPVQTLWAELREAQSAGLAEPRTAMVPTIDIGDPNDLHPHNKAEVGRRLALAALATAYDRTEPDLLAPRIVTVTRDGGTVRVGMTNGESGLRLNGGHLRGFEIAGDDQRFSAAEAVVDDLELVVWSPFVPAPRWLRYAWADMPVADVCTPAGLPLAPCAAREVSFND
jgi:sialate O-acetylesterase